MSWLVAVTGANRGFGRAVAVELARRVPGAEMVLSSRAGCNGMGETVKEVEGAGGVVTNWEVDMCGEAWEGVKKVFGQFEGRDFERVVVVHNAGSTGDLIPAGEHGPSPVDADIKANLNAPINITNAIMKTLPHLHSKMTFINVSSLFALQPASGFSLYCTCKAARDMYFSCLTIDHPTIRTLNYAPGPMETDMAQHIKDTHHSADVKKQFSNIKMVNPNDSAKVLVTQIIDNQFKSGSHVDYFELLPPKEN